MNNLAEMPVWAKTLYFVGFCGLVGGVGYALYFFNGLAKMYEAVEIAREENDIDYC